jgi:ethanolamine-phosphate cytidylyltransferase
MNWGSRQSFPLNSSMRSITSNKVNGQRRVIHCAMTDQKASVEKRSATEDAQGGSTPRKQKKFVKVWTDGCFDMMHFGHANALRQAKALGDYLVVGVHSDAEIMKHKGPPVMNEEERYAAVAACKWVDEVVKDAPYVTSLEIMDKYGCDFCVHGDDVSTTADGKDTYEEVKKAGRFRTVPRTVGVSTTDLVGRMLLMTKSHHQFDDSAAALGFPQGKLREFTEGGSTQTPETKVSQFLPSSRRIVQFSEGRDPKPDDVIVYIDGAFDLFHVGHVDILREAKKLGTYLIVGVHSDQTVNKKRGNGYPIMNLHERVLGVLSCRYVDEVLIGAPWEPTEEMIRQHRISYVVKGTVNDVGVTTDAAILEFDPYKVPRRLGILREIKSPRTLTTSEIVHRIIENRKKYEERNRKKEEKDKLLQADRK